jgi:hypothetical protein
MSKSREHKTLMDRLKSYYQGAEREAAKTTPFYVTGDGVMFADPKEVIRSQAVQNQLSAFESLRTEIQGKKDDAKKTVTKGD